MEPTEGQSLGMAESFRSRHSGSAVGGRLWRVARWLIVIKVVSGVLEGMSGRSEKGNGMHHRKHRDRSDRELLPYCPLLLLLDGSGS